MSDAASTFRARVERDLRTAMRERDPIAVPALRAVLSAVDNAGAVDASTLETGATEVPRRHVAPDEVAAIVVQVVREREEAARHYTDLGQHQAATRLSAEAAIMRRCLDLG